MHNTTGRDPSSSSIQIRLFLIRGLAAIVWAAAFAIVGASMTTGVTVAAGVLLVLYPLIDVVGSLIDARNQQGSARRLLVADAAVSTIAVVALGVAAIGVSRRSSSSSDCGPPSPVRRSWSSPYAVARCSGGSGRCCSRVGCPSSSVSPCHRGRGRPRDADHACALRRHRRGGFHHPILAAGATAPSRHGCEPAP